ncbi:hypothetical protein ACP4OV_007023 [Aristida adscensionis]
MWGALQHASSVAQLAGVDALGLVAATVRAAQTARRNRRTCRELAAQVERIGDLLRSLDEQPGVELLRRPETSAPLAELSETLRRARAAVESCRRGGYTGELCAGGSRAARLRDAQSRIAFFLQLFPIISHLDSTRLLVRVIDGAAGRRTPANAAGEGDEDVLMSLTNHLNTPHARFQKYSFSQLVHATDSFSFEKQIEKGPLATLYKGQLHGSDVTIKRLTVSCSGQPLPQSLSEYELFQNEVKILPELQHNNIVKLVGFCTERSERVLVYEYMQNGSLEDLIFGRMRAGLEIDWPTRFRIIEGIAQGAVYLHNHSRLRVIHRDLKPSNILLDSDMTPKISNFDLAKVMSQGNDEDTTNSVVGSIGFIAPEYMSKGVFSVKTDVYSFGVMILEIISGKRWTHSLQETYYRDLVAWSFRKSMRRRLKDLVDPPLQGVALRGRGMPRCLSLPARRSALSRQSQMRRCTRVGLLCIQEKPERRPAMPDAARMLFGPRKPRAPPFPRRPGHAAGSHLYAGDRSPAA